MQKNRLAELSISLADEVRGWKKEFDYIALNEAEPGSVEFGKMKETLTRIIEFKVPDDLQKTADASLLTEIDRLQMEARLTIQTLRDRELFSRHQQEWIEPKLN